MRLALAFALVGLGALALLTAAGGAAAYHTNPTCQGGSYTQTWNADVTIISPQAPIVDECILVQANVSVQAGGELRFRDTALYFDNTVGNFTLSVNQSGLLEFRDDDGNAATNDRSRMGVLFDNITWTGFFFVNDPGARLYFNDTDIHGGGLPPGGLGSAGAFFVDGPGDFTWARITHLTPSSGLVLANYTKGMTVPNYAVSGVGVTPFEYGLALLRCANITVTGYSNPLGLGFTGVFSNEGRDIIVRNSTTKASAFGFRFLLTDNVLVEDTQSQSHADTGFLFDRVQFAVLNRLTAAPPGTGHFGLRLVSSQNVEVRNLVLQRHDTADLDITGATRWVNVTLATISQTRAGTGIRVIGTGAADEGADINFRSVNVTQKGPAGGSAVLLRNADRVLFDGYNITGSAGVGVRLETSSNVRLFRGAIRTNTEGVGYTSSGNLSISWSDLDNNAGGGLAVESGSFTLDNVSMQANGGWSIRSTAVAQMTGQSAIYDSTLEGVFGSVVSLILSSGSTARLDVANCQFVRLQNDPRLYWALDLDGFAAVSVSNSRMDSFGIQVARTGDVGIRDSTMDVVLLPTNTTLMRFDRVGSLVVDRVAFGNDPVSGKLERVINVTRLLATAQLLNMSFPRADYGIFVQGEGGSFSSSLVVANVRMAALVDGATVRAVHNVTLERMTMFRTQRAVVLDVLGTLAGPGAVFAVVNSTFQSSGVGILSRSDDQATLRVENISYDRTNSTPTTALSASVVRDVFLRAVRVEGVATGIDLRNARFVWMSDMDFVDNTWGLRMVVDQGLMSDLNWTVDRPTQISNSRLQVRGQIWVMSSTLSVVRASRVDVFSTQASPGDTRVHLEGTSLLRVNETSSIVGSARNEATSSPEGRYTVELSPQSTVDIRDAVLDRLGSTGPAVPPERRGIYLRAADATFTNVRFLNASAALRADGVNLTIDSCEFTGVDNQLALDVRGGTLRVSGGSTFHRGTDGIRVVGGASDVSNASFEDMGAALTVDGSSGTFVDSWISRSSEAIRATNASNLMACRLHLESVSQLIVATNSSTVRLCDSQSFLSPSEGESLSGSIVELENVFVNRSANGALAYGAVTTGGTYRAYWWVTVLVTSCPVGSNSPLDGVNVLVRDQSTNVANQSTTGPDGRVGPMKLLYWQSQGTTSTFLAPFVISATRGQLSATITHAGNQTADIEVCLDDQPPVLRLSLPSEWTPDDWNLSDTRNASIAIRGSTWDNFSGLETGYPCLSTNGDTCTPIAPNFDLQRTLREGMNTFVIVTRDRFGNEAAATINIVRDTTAPVFVSCDPPQSFKTAFPQVALTCQMSGDPLNPPTISGARSSGARIDGSQLLHATIILDGGINAFQVTVTDALGNTNTSSFSWALDNVPPQPILVNGYNETVTRVFGVFLRATLPSDVVSVTFDGLDVTPGSSTLNTEWKNLTEGRNEKELRITDDVGNVWRSTLWLDVDTQTNCTLFAPSNGERRTVDTVAVGGSCDLDVTVSISGLVGALTPSADGRWSGQVQLHQGANQIDIHGVDSNGVEWDERVTVIYETAQTEGIPFVVILLIIIAVGVFVAAFVIMRRPRRPTPEEPPRIMTGSQKAPPRPKPPPLRLPDLPDDPRFKPPPPPPPPPRR